MRSESAGRSGTRTMSSTGTPCWEACCCLRSANAWRFEGEKAFQKRGGSGKKEARAELSSSLSAMVGCSCRYVQVVAAKGPSVI